MKKISSARMAAEISLLVLCTMSLDVRLQHFKNRMDLSVEAFIKELSGIRTGRASAALLEPIKIDVYGAPTPINQVGTLSVPDAKTIIVSVWDKGLVKNVEKAIRECGANLNPSVEGQSVRVPIPPLSDERRQELSKLAAKYAEDAKVAIRNIRRDAMDFIKQLEKNNEIGEDEMRKLSDSIQSLTNDISKQIDSVSAAKQKDLLKI
ncbi:MAG: ribosome recycling factor [Holosporales bacterium]|jgi:ribosome recycling factor|nr:ribosome recycling factor [Holosporales bacterium]